MVLSHLRSHMSQRNNYLYVLCGPWGASKYKLNSTNKINQALLFQNIALNTSKLLGGLVAVFLVVLLIWAAFIDVDDYDLKNDVQQKFQKICLNQETKPVEKVTIEVIYPGAYLSFIELIGQPNDGPTKASQTMSTRTNAVITSQQTVIVQRLDEMNMWTNLHNYQAI